MEKDSKIYVAGHLGLVGSAILRSLEAHAFTNLIFRTHRELDLINSNAVKEFFKAEKPEYVFLTAAKVGGIAANNLYRANFLYENLMIQNNVIHNSYQSGVKKLLFLGSSCIYPKNAPQPLKEEYLLTDVLEYTNEPYAIAKIAGIKMCESYNLQYGTNFISVMPANLYGPNDNFDPEKSHVLPALLRKLHLAKALESANWEIIKKDLNYLPIQGIDGNSSRERIREVLAAIGIKEINHEVSVEIWGSGKPMREFLWAEDLADACVFVMNTIDFSDCIEDKNEIRNTHINIGTGEDISISDLAILLKKTVGFRGNFIYNRDKPDGTMKKLTNVSKLHDLGWKHKINIEEGISKMYDWYLKR